MSKKVIITADDYGYINLIDDAIIGAAENNRITTVSAFSNIPIEELNQKISRLKNANPTIGIGLHLTITSGKPLTAPQYIASEKDGILCFKTPKKIVLKKIPISDVENELMAQLNQMRQVLGNQIDHISCHHNILYLYPSLFEVYLKIAKEANLPIRTPRNCISQTKFSPLRALNPALIPPYIEDAFNVMNPHNIVPALKAVSNENVTKQENDLAFKNINTSSYFLIHHYGNQINEVFETTYNLIGENETCEQIMHLARAANDEDLIDFPNGINKNYLVDRNKELILIMSNEFLNLKNGSNQLTFSKYS
jgi:predicted glycoside hydrolase/deacetylase ChbG (UPF0249 family)